MNNPPEHSLPEEPAQSPTLHTPDEEPRQTAIFNAEEVPLPPVAETAGQEEESSIEPGDASAPVLSEPAADSAERGPLAEAGTLEGEPVEQETSGAIGDIDATEPPVADPDAIASSADSDLTEASSTEENNEPDAAPTVIAAPPAKSSGVFVPRSLLIAAVSVLVLIALLAALLVFVNRPQDPPTDWIGSYTPPAGSSSTGKILYYLHWTNQNGSLNGQLQLAANSNGKLQSLTVPATGLYNRDNHIIYVVVTISGQPDTLTGNINNTNDTLMLNEVGATSQDSQIVFHRGSSNDYNQATKKLVPAAKPTSAAK